MTQTYKVQVSMNQAHIVESGFVWKQGDFGFNIEIEVLDFDTTGATPQIIFRKSTGAVEATQISVAGNKFTYAIRGTELDTPGPCVCDLKLNDSTTKRVSTASFKYFVIPDTMDGLEQEASSYSDTIEQIAAKLNAQVENISDAITYAQESGFNYIDLTFESGTITNGVEQPNGMEIRSIGMLEANGCIAISNISEYDLYVKFVRYNSSDEFVGNDQYLVSSGSKYEYEMSTAQRVRVVVSVKNYVDVAKASFVQVFIKNPIISEVSDLSDRTSTLELNQLKTSNGLGETSFYTIGTESIVANKIINRTGGIESASGYQVNNPIYIGGLDEITIDNYLIGNQYVYMAGLYRLAEGNLSECNSYTLIGFVDTKDETPAYSIKEAIMKITVPEGANYIVFTLKDNKPKLYLHGTDLYEKAQNMIEDLKDESRVINSINLFDKANAALGKFIGSDGNLYNNNDYFVTDYIPVKPLLKYIWHPYSMNGAYSVLYGSNKKIKTILPYNSELIVNGVFTIPTDVYFVRTCGLKTNINISQFEQGEISNIYESFSNNILADRKNIINNPLTSYRDSLDSAHGLTLSASNSKNKNVLSFTCNISTMGRLKIANGTGYGACFITVDETYIKVYRRTTEDILVETITHNVQIENNLSIVINCYEYGKAKFNLASINGGYTGTTGIAWLCGLGNLSVTEQAAGEYTNAKLNWYASAIDYNLWGFGDSYYDMIIWWMKNAGFTEFMIDGFSGRGSLDAYASLEKCLRNGTPKKILWSIGMNDPDSDTAINTNWQNIIEKIMTFCDRFNVELILSTIPNTPVRNHSFKNAYIRNSGRRYIDISEVVGAESDINWYDGLLSGDEIHPTTNGQIVIANAIMAGIPETKQ